MKKYLIGCFIILITACQTATQIPTTESVPTETPLSTLPLVTESPTVDFTATVPPTPEPPSFYFTDEFTSETPSWEFLQTGGTSLPTTTFINDTLQINISSPDTWMIGIHNVHTYSNVFIQAKASVSPTGSIGLVCSYDESTGWFEYNVSSDGSYNVLLGQWLAEGIAKYIPIADGSNNQISASNSIGLDCRDNFLNIYINETIIRRIDVTNYGITEGQIGITASSFLESPHTSTFEWIQVSQ